MITTAYRRTEAEVVADAIVALYEARLLPPDAATVQAVMKVVGLTLDDMHAAKWRRSTARYVPPQGKPTLDTDGLFADQAAESPPPPDVPVKTRAWQRVASLLAEDVGQTRVCNKCEVEKPITDFQMSNSSTGRRRYECSKCWNRYQGERYLSVAKAKALDAARITFVVREDDGAVGLACVDCGKPIQVGEAVWGESLLHHKVCPVTAEHLDVYPLTGEAS